MMRITEESLKIIDYQTSLSHYFYEINKEWVSAMFVMEAIDEKVLKNPDEYIIAQGGRIWFVEHPSHGIVGTCALKNHGQNNFELTKMGVFKKARGLKVGEFLLKHVIKESISHMDISNLFLLTNKDCQAAIHLYEKNGFHHSQEVMNTYGSLYSRCNVAMIYKG